MHAEIAASMLNPIAARECFMTNLRILSAPSKAATLPNLAQDSHTELSVFGCGNLTKSCICFSPVADILGPCDLGGMSFVVRTACAADIPAMHRVRRKVRQNRLSDPRTITEALYLPYIEAGSAWVAVTDTHVAGFAAVDPDTKTLWALFVDPGAEGTGVGQALHRQLVGWARERGIHRLTLTTEKGTRAAEFYKRNGWREAGATPGGELLFELTVSA